LLGLGRLVAQPFLVRLTCRGFAAAFCRDFGTFARLLLRTFEGVTRACVYGEKPAGSFSRCSGANYVRRLSSFSPFKTSTSSSSASDSNLDAFDTISGCGASDSLTESSAKIARTNSGLRDAPGTLEARCPAMMTLGRRLVKFITLVYGIQVVLAGGLGFGLALTLAVGV
jgi:hypothetical protein